MAIGCPECGTPNEDGMRYCLNCGVALRGAPAAAPPAPPPPEVNVSGQPQKQPPTPAPGEIRRMAAPSVPPVVGAPEETEEADTTAPTGIGPPAPPEHELQGPFEGVSEPGYTDRTGPTSGYPVDVDARAVTYDSPQAITAVQAQGHPAGWQPYFYPVPLYSICPWWCPMPYPYSPYAPQYPGGVYGTVRPRKRMSAAALVLIILGVLLVLGGGIAAAVLLTGPTKSSYKLGDSSVTGGKIDFRDLVLKQDGNTLTLSGTYDNESKNAGEVYITVNAISGGSEQSVIFTVTVKKATGEKFSQKKTFRSRLTGATLGTLVFQPEEKYDEDKSSYPWDEEGSEEGKTTPSNKEKSTSTPSAVPINETTQYQGVDLEIISVETEQGDDGGFLLKINIEAQNQSADQVYIFWNEESRLLDEAGGVFPLHDYDMETDFTPGTQSKGILCFQVNNKDQVFTLQFGKSGSPEVELELDLAGAG